MLRSTTILAETATVLAPTATTAKTAVSFETNEQGENTAILIDKNKAALGFIVGTISTAATTVGQEVSNYQTKKNIETAYAYVESLSDKSLAELVEMLEEKEASLENTENVETTGKSL